MQILSLRFYLSVLVIMWTADVFAHTEVSDRIQLLTKAIKNAPEDAQLYLRRGELWRQEGHLQPASKDCVRAGKLDPKLIEAHLCSGNVLLEMNRPREAKEAFDKYLRRVPYNAAARAERARCLVLLKQHSEAIEDFTVALRLSPSPDIYLERASAFLAENSSQKEPALQSVQEGIEKLGPIVTLELFALELELAMYRYDAALLRIDRMLKTAARKEALLERKGQILQKAGRLPEACNAFTVAWKTFNDMPQSRRSSRSNQALQIRLQNAAQLCKSR